jgi:glutamate decarboxylase
MGPFKIIYDGRGGIPGLCWSLKEGLDHPFTLYDIADRLRGRGWQVPAYSMPKNREDLVIQRIVVRHGFSRDLATLLLEDMHRALQYFEKRPVSLPMTEKEVGGFHHT